VNVVASQPESRRSDSSADRSPAESPADPEIQGPQDLLEYERRFWGRGRFVAGVDEAGRGPLAGPVVAAAVVLPMGTCVPGADDSKVLEAEVREKLYAEILTIAHAVGIGAASVREIDRRNILRATTVAMQRALDGLGLPHGPVASDSGGAASRARKERARESRPERQDVHVVVDGLPVKYLSHDHDAVVDGDALVHTIGCASIVAKVVRDRLMRRLATRYPGYGWETNVGYGTPTHRSAIEDLGVTPHHRLTFAGLQYEMEL